MKKLLFVVLSLFVINVISAQVVGQEIKYYRTGKWNSYTETWDYTRLVPGNGLLLSANAGIVSLDDKNGSIYRAYATVELDKQGITKDGTHYKSSVFKALDKDGVKCNILIISYIEDQELKVSIMYDNEVINYFVKTK